MRLKEELINALDAHRFENPIQPFFFKFIALIQGQIVLKQMLLNVIQFMFKNFERFCEPWKKFNQRTTVKSISRWKTKRPNGEWVFYMIWTPSV